jgi:pantoate--beta-alanine ligase
VTPPPVIHTARELSSLVASWKGAGETVALVPTMGALHQGHLALVTRARQIADRVVVSIFVNPLQFGAGEDFDRYPRTLADDVTTLGPTGVDAVFAPEVTEVYPDWPDTTPRIHAGAIGRKYEGADRPGHFDGVLTVVDRLFELVGCDVAVFGQKDAQQVFLVTDLATGRTPPFDIDVVATVRDSDGLALSSRNRYLTPDARRSALAIPQAVSQVVDDLGSALRESLNADSVQAILDMAISGLTAPDRHCHYLDVVVSETFEQFRGQPEATRVVVIAACTVSGVRLLDAVAVTLQVPAGH